MRGRYVHRDWLHDPAGYAPPAYRRPCSYEAFVPDTIAGRRLELAGEVAGVVSEAEMALAALHRGHESERMPLARMLLRAEAVASSRIEGMHVDARTLARAEASPEIARRVGFETAEILGNIAALELAVRDVSTEERVHPDALLRIHRILLAGDPGVRGPGAFRKAQNWIGGNDYNPCGADFVPPPPEEVDRLVDDLCRFCNQDELPPLLHAAIAHAQFETIHPFVDGNGRTGRALVQMILRRRGLAREFVLPVSVVLAQHRDRYISGLRAYRADRLAEWVEVFASASVAAAQHAGRYRGEVAELQDRWRQRLRDGLDPRADAAAWAIIDILPGCLTVTVAIGVGATGRTRPAVANGIAALESVGVLLPLSASKRNRAWEADGLLDLVGGLESGHSLGHSGSYDAEKVLGEEA